MFTHFELVDTIQITTPQKVELFVEPILGFQAQDILDSVTGDKIYLTRINFIDAKSKLIKKSTKLFSISLDEDSEEENLSSDKTYLEINSDMLDNSSNIKQVGNNFTAKVDGLFLNVNDKLMIVPVSLDGSSEIKISDDSMYLNLDIFPSLENNPIPTDEDIISKIKEMGVKREINTKLLSQKLEDVKENGTIVNDLCIVEGEQPIHGLDGRFENLTEKKEKLKTLNYDDFYRVNPVISVKEKELIAILHPPTEGTVGYDIFNNRVDPIPGEQCKLKIGKNVSFLDDDGENIIAKKDGFLDVSSTSISITDTFTVRGDIDFESGNIIAKGSLRVIGNVQNEFSLDLSKDIIVGGYVRDAKINSGQSVSISGGFLGKGSGILKSGGETHVKFVENQKIYSRESIHLFKDALNAKLFAKQSILSSSGRSAIIGGHSIAGDFIEVFSLGNDTGTKTVVEVGFDYLKRDAINDNKGKQSQLRNKLEEVDKSIFEFAKMKRRNTQSQKKLEVLAELHKKLVAEIENINEQNIKTTSEIYVPTSSKISIDGTIFPGVIIGINGRFMTINSPMRAKTFVLSEDNEVIAV